MCVCVICHTLDIFWNRSVIFGKVCNKHERRNVIKNLGTITDVTKTPMFILNAGPEQICISFASFTPLAQVAQQQFQAVCSLSHFFLAWKSEHEEFKPTEDCAFCEIIGMQLQSQRHISWCRKILLDAHCFNQLSEGRFKLTFVKLHSYRHLSPELFEGMMSML